MGLTNVEFELASSWIKAFGDAVSQANVKALLDCLEPSCWFRDLLVFNPSLETRHGHDAIRTHLQSALGKAQVSNVVLDSHPHGSPRASQVGPVLPPIIETAFDFETPKALGKGYVRLNYPKEGDGEIPKALAVMMMLRDWKGHEEPQNESGVYGGHTLTWGEIIPSHRSILTPRLVGAGQAGLDTAARFRQMGIRAIVIEQTARVGDVWRNRYPTLALHTPRSHHGLLYQPFPSNWPTFTPRDKLANWFERYAEDQDLVVWTSTTLVPTPKYDSTTKRWDLTVIRNCTPIRLRPQHIVMAMSALGDPVIPSLKGSSSFGGDILHAGTFPGAEQYKGKRVVVLGAGNTSVDICQDLVFRGAQSVTMIQRSETCVVSDKYVTTMITSVFPEDRPTYYSDLSFAGLPLGAFRELGKILQPFVDELHKDMHDGLKKAGMKLFAGPDGSGQLVMAFDRQGASLTDLSTLKGYFVDVGCAELIINGKVKVKQGVEIDHLTEKTAVFTDGSELEADAIILATGWHPVREKLVRLFGKEAIDKTSPLMGNDEHGEMRAGWKPSGQPGLWFAIGDFSIARFASKLLVSLLLPSTSVVADAFTGDLPILVR
ncbi:FAD/NAD-binding domain-containing protein [Fomitiporia mediterranea MF3/22]|uniref:FAD/NAD-binding domain-containing protein n=1 Tax=Fomitiporia mediterranea (strain MF3/22) TaxID=694068 RepID=UPI000440933E|nr:FAD/NAD-binding domain-containing protein [Fomitiporia mediterranea MF3/22]EJC98968.1 FAD/NAD-binding domain-containing protein [Fomitiporia mediterranea MF3/22]